jgi:hypothetical protein
MLNHLLHSLLNPGKEIAGQNLTRRFHPQGLLNLDRDEKLSTEKLHPKANSKECRMAA